MQSLTNPPPPLPLTIHALYYIPITCPACAVTHQCCSSREQLGIVTCTINYVYTADNICPGYLQLLLRLSIIFFSPIAAAAKNLKRVRLGHRLRSGGPHAPTTTTTRPSSRELRPISHSASLAHTWRRSRYPSWVHFVL